MNNLKFKVTDFLPSNKVDKGYVKTVYRGYMDDIKCYSINDDLEIVNSLGLLTKDEEGVFYQHVDNEGKGVYRAQWFTKDLDEAVKVKNLIIRMMLRETTKQLEYLTNKLS